LINAHGWFFPDHEEHLQLWLQRNGVKVDGRLAYQWRKIQAAVDKTLDVRKHEPLRTAIDVGGHIGLWSFYLSKQFAHVHAFEPVAEHRACFELNTTNITNIDLHPVALGDPEDESTAMVAIHTSKGSSGDSWVKGKGSIPMRRLDDFDFRGVDLIKIDCEGYELFVLQGGQELIRRERPVIIVEQKPGKAKNFGLPDTHAVTWLKANGYELVRELSGDFLMAPAA